MANRLSLTTKFDNNTNKSNITVNPVNNVSVNLSTDKFPEAEVRAMYTEQPAENPYGPEGPQGRSPYSTEDKEDPTVLDDIEALKLIIKMYKDNPILVNKLVIADDDKLSLLVKLLTHSDEVTIDAEDLGAGCCAPTTYRKVHSIYVSKDGMTKNLKYDYPNITKLLKELGISTKLVW